MVKRRSETTTPDEPSTETHAAQTEPDAVRLARQAVEAERSKLARFEADQAAARAELASLEDRAGAEALDDPDALQRLPRVMAELRDRVEILGRAMAAQAPRVTDAERAYLTAEADVLEAAELAPAQAALDAHEVRTAELVAALVEHEGPGRFVTDAEQAMADHDFGRTGPVSITLPRGEQLRDAVTLAGRRVRVLRTMAAGEDPAELLRRWQAESATTLRGAELYPACVWGPQALVPAPAYVRTRETEARRSAELETARAAVARQVERLEADVAAGKVAPVQFQDWSLAKPKSLADQLQAAQRRHADLTAQLEQLETPAGV